MALPPVLVNWKFQHADLFVFWLKASKADCLIITGLTTSGCVRASVVDALQYDYPTFVPREAVGDRNPSAHTANLHDINAKYGDVVGVADVLSYLEALS